MTLQADRSAAPRACFLPPQPRGGAATFSVNLARRAGELSAPTAAQIARFGSNRAFRCETGALARAISSILAAVSALASAVSADPLEGKLSSAEILEATTAEDWRPLDPENTLYIELESGRVTVALSPVLAQGHVANMKKLAREGFYDGLSFYRVIDGFVAQGGDALGVKGEGRETLTAEFDEPAPEDFAFYRLKDRDGYAPQAGIAAGLPAGYDPKSKRAWHLHCTGAIAMGREDAKDTASTEFYIALQPQRYLDRNLSVFGRVVDGMERVQVLRRVAPPEAEGDDLGDKIVSVKVAADVDPSGRTDFEVLRSDRPVFGAHVEARRNRPEAFFHFRPDHIDVCQLPIPLRPAGAE